MRSQICDANENHKFYNRVNMYVVRVSRRQRHRRRRRFHEFPFSH